MPVQKSYVEFVRGTYSALFVDCADRYPELTKEFNRDYKRLSSAIDQHGIRFVLDVLPAFRKHFDKCLAESRLIPSNLTHFGVDKVGGTIPRLFRGLVLRVFDRSGALRPDCDVEAIRMIRQLLGVVRKLRLESHIRDQGNAVADFIKTDLEVKSGTLSWDSHLSFEPEEAHRLSFREACVTSDSDGDLFLDPQVSLPYGLLDKVQQVADLICAHLGVFAPTEWKPRHGPGAVADQRFGSYKYDFKTWPDRLENVFPWADFAFANYAHVPTILPGSRLGQELSREIPAKLCAVPKTISTPRLIACEPTSLQWCQQTLRDFFYQRTADSWFNLFIDFRRQELNGELALQAAHSGKHATIDLSSASDRVSCWHVERLFRRSPSLLWGLQSSRSLWIKQDICKLSARYHYLRKFSTMGNAVTFPVQSLFFLSLALGTLAYVRKVKVTEKAFRGLGKMQVRVFGDDIIVPEDCFGQLVELLGALGLRVNAAKTFAVGNFRESCGVDAFAGHDVTTTNILEVPRSAGPGSIVSAIDTHHNLCEAGLYALASHIRKTATRCGFSRIRTVKHRSGLFGWSDLEAPEMPDRKIRYNRDLQIWEERALAVKVKTSFRPSDESSALLQFFTEAAKKVTSATSTLHHLVRRPQGKLALRWVPILAG